MQFTNSQCDFFTQLVSDYPSFQEAFLKLPFASSEKASSLSQVFGLELLHLRRVFGLEAISETVPDLWSCLVIHLLIGISMAMGGIESTGLS